MGWPLTIPETITAAQDILLAIAGIVTAGVAVKGLNTWRQQLRGTADFETARAMATATYAVREALTECRWPAIWAFEFPPGHHTGPAKDAQQEAEAYSFVYTNRWKPVAEAMGKLDAKALEAEALWGEPIREAVEGLRKVAVEVRVAIDTLIADKASGGRDFAGDRDFAKETRATVSGRPGQQGNATSARLDDAVKAIEALLRPHLKRP